MRDTRHFLSTGKQSITIIIGSTKVKFIPSFAPFKKKSPTKLYTMVHNSPLKGNKEVYRCFYHLDTQIRTASAHRTYNLKVATIENDTSVHNKTDI